MRGYGAVREALGFWSRDEAVFRDEDAVVERLLASSAHEAARVPLPAERLHRVAAHRLAAYAGSGHLSDDA